MKHEGELADQSASSPSSQTTGEVLASRLRLLASEGLGEELIESSS